ncbi:MAG: right-handed parallel beta-helix repeat-containing protein [Bythopirellula sp.]|nr:right-handed parallel beta-helix repeat-containing protein [Bythopirellula sp.]
MPTLAKFLFVSAIMLSGSLAARADSHKEVENFLKVPEEYCTVQAAIDAGRDGDTILISPGVYHEALTIAGKSITLASWYLTTKEPRYIKQTVLDGSIIPDPEDEIDAVVDAVISMPESPGTESTILGLTIRDGDDGLACSSRVRVLFNHFVNNTDAIDYENGSGECRFNTFVANDDDGVDLDNSSEVLVANNEMRDNDDDGIEMRLHPHVGKMLNVVIRDNIITGNGEDGIQIIDYPEMSDRTITIERNLIAENAMAGIGFMSDAVTLEDYRGAAIPESITIINNTICRNHYGMVGGGNARVLNNLFVENLHAPLKNVNGQSQLTHNLLWQNGGEPVNSNLGAGVLLRKDPQLDKNFRPIEASFCIDRGTTQLDLASSVRAVLPEAFHGEAPDLGAFEIR